MEKEGLQVNRKAKRGSTLSRSRDCSSWGGRYVALVCDSDVFHNVADRWPEAVDVATLARYGTRFCSERRSDRAHNSVSTARCCPNKSLQRTRLRAAELAVNRYPQSFAY